MSTVPRRGREGEDESVNKGGSPLVSGLLSPNHFLIREAPLGSLTVSTES